MAKMQIQKSQPTINQVHQDAALTNIAVAFLQQGGFLADELFAPVPVAKKSDKFYTYSANAFRKSNAEFRAPGAPPAKSGVAPTTSSYEVERMALASAIPDPVRDNADAALELDRSATDFVTMSLMLSIEKNFIDNFWTTGKWTGSSTATDITPGTLWDDVSSDPIADVQTEMRSVEVETGFTPNVFGMGRKVFDNLLRHPDVIELISGMGSVGSPAIANADTLARVFGVERVVVARASRDSSQEGKAASFARLADEKDALLVYRPPVAGRFIPAAGYTFVWNGVGNALGVALKRYRLEEERESTQVEANRWFVFKQVAAKLGVFFNNAVAA